jgi:hypothetical protein
MTQIHPLQRKNGRSQFIKFSVFEAFSFLCSQNCKTPVELEGNSTSDCFGSLMQIHPLAKQNRIVRRFKFSEFAVLSFLSSQNRNAPPVPSFNNPHETKCGAASSFILFAYI